MSYLVNQLQEKMAQKNLSIHALEKKAGVKRGVIQNVIYGRSKNPRFEILQSIAQILECNVYDLIEDKTDSYLSLASKQSSQNKIVQDAPMTWNADLYKKCFDRVEFFAQQYNQTLSRSDLLDYVNNVYQFTLEQKRLIPDDIFIKWLLKKYLTNK